MEKLKAILDEIDKTCNENLDESMKKYILGNLWKRYNIEKNNIICDEIYIIDQEPTYEKVNLESVRNAISNLKDGSATIDDAEALLKWNVQNTREGLTKLGLNIKKDSLDGYCELSQLLSIYPLEELGLEVTKNTARYCFDYPYNHAFGTVKIPVIENGNKIDKYFLIDVTYRQFFVREKCSKIQYYLDDMIAPSVGFFVKDKQFAKTLIRDGFIELTPSIAKEYGEPFTKAGLDYTNIDYFDSIINCKSDYVLSTSEIGDLNVKLP